MTLNTTWILDMFPSAEETTGSECNEIHFPIASDFLGCLSVLPFKQAPYCGTLENIKAGRWLFRGHWDEGWALRPSAHRGAQPFNKIRSSPLPAPNSVTKKEYWPKMVEAEVFALEQFQTLANDSSLPCEFSAAIYDEIASMRDYYSRQHYAEAEFFPKSKWYPIMARAQHHGIPTRLLDFTSDSLHAAFFAASKLVDEPDHSATPSQKLCVWAFFDTDFPDLSREPDINRESKQWLMVPAISQLGSNLASQRGSLILHEGANKYFENHGEWPDFFSCKSDVVDRKKRFMKLTLAQDQGPEMLLLLARKGITPVRIYPSLDNVTETLKYLRWLEG